MKRKWLAESAHPNHRRIRGTTRSDSKQTAPWFPSTKRWDSYRHIHSIMLDPILLSQGSRTEHRILQHRMPRHGTDGHRTPCHIKGLQQRIVIRMYFLKKTRMGPAVRWKRRAPGIPPSSPGASHPAQPSDDSWRMAEGFAPASLANSRIALQPAQRTTVTAHSPPCSAASRGRQALLCAPTPAQGERDRRAVWSIRRRHAGSFGWQADFPCFVTRRPQQ
jgi:hypothetical protein